MKQPTAITKSIKARFTTINSEVAVDQIETNLVTSCSNVLKVYTITEKSIDLRQTLTFNDRIIELIRIPTSNYLQTNDFKAPMAPKGKPVEKTNKTGGKASRSTRRVVDIEE